MAITNFGGTWPQFISYWLVDSLTKSYCYNGKDGDIIGNCVTPEVNDYLQILLLLLERKLCFDKGVDHFCQVERDGYYLVGVCSIFFGFFWIFSTRNLIKKLENIPNRSWMIHLGS